MFYLCVDLYILFAQTVTHPYIHTFILVPFPSHIGMLIKLIYKSVYGVFMGGLGLLLVSLTLSLLRWFLPYAVWTVFVCVFFGGALWFHSISFILS